MAYLRGVNADVCEVKFVIGKSRVAPLKFLTIPRLELTAATLAVRMAYSIATELKIPIA